MSVKHYALKCENDLVYCTLSVENCKTSRDNEIPL